MISEGETIQFNSDDAIKTLYKHQTGGFYLLEELRGLNILDFKYLVATILLLMHKTQKRSQWVQSFSWLYTKLLFDTLPFI